MIEVSDTVRAIIDGGTMNYYVKVSAWRDDELLAEDIPISAGGEESDRSSAVPERIVLTVPKVDRGVSWMPVTDGDPLGAEGQRLKVSLGVGKGADGIEWWQRGEFVLFSTEEDEDGKSLRVTAVGLLYLVQEAGFVSPFQPSGTIAGTLRALIEPAVSADLDSAPADRSVTSTTANWDDRLGAVYELLDAWPAAAFMNEQGYLEILPDVTPTVAVRSFSDRRGGTMVTAVGASTRDGGFNVVVATGTAADGGEVRGQAYVTSGPWTYGTGSANPLPVPFGYSSPLLATTAQCTAAAGTVLARKMRAAVLRRFTVICAPDPTIQLGDPVSITNDEVTELLCTVETLSLPYTPGPMTMQVVSTT